MRRKKEKDAGQTKAETAFEAIACLGFSPNP